MSTSFATHHAGHVALDWRKAFHHVAAFFAAREPSAAAPELPAELRRLPAHLLADIGVDPRFAAETDFPQRGTAPGL
ncbi:hypothetical protein [Rhizobium sp. FKL33]|uniref:hypothetical protein n=1 Tax=Rhizobium sp. FKL33 TaxID=2562307 RepID=UPI0010C0C08B|nr:hypothetical protein [Rhizobium sp. FKL33]